MKYHIGFVMSVVLLFWWCSDHKTNENPIIPSDTWFVNYSIDVSQYEKILSKRLINFVPNFPVVSWEKYSDPDWDGKVPWLLLSIQRTDIWVQFQYIKELTAYYHNNSWLSLTEYVNQLDLSNISRSLLNQYHVQVITWDWKNVIKSWCNLIPRHILTDYDGKKSEYRPIQTLIHREGYPDNDPMSAEYRLCNDANAELYIDRELWALNDTFAIRLPQCWIWCAPWPDFRRAATIRPI